jgi:hypothetical protein
MGIGELKLEGDDGDLIVGEDGSAGLCCLCVDFGLVVEGIYRCKEGRWSVPFSFLYFFYRLYTPIERFFSTGWLGTSENYNM